MAWLKSSDTSYDHPVVVAPLAWSAEHLDGLDPYDAVSTLYGLVWRCATYNGGKGQDYVVTDAVIAQMAGTKWRVRAAQAAHAGYWARCEDGKSWLLLDDAEHLFHIRRKAEIEWERARKRDNSNPAFIVPVRLRDGDGCRYCGNIVQWNARTGGRHGTYDHRNPGTPARSPDDLVVACGLCNSTRRDNPDAEAWPLLPAPTNPYYGPRTLELLARHGRHITAPGEPAPSGTTPGELASSGPTPIGDRGAAAATRSQTHAPADLPEVQPSPDRNAGRVGYGPGRPRKRARRGRRGGRGPQSTVGGDNHDR